MHRSLPAGMNLDVNLCIKTERTVRNDFTIVHRKNLYQIMSRICPRKVIVEERINGKMLLSGNGSYLNYKPIRVKPVIKTAPKAAKITWRPPANHPWKSLSYQKRIAPTKKEALVVI